MAKTKSVFVCQSCGAESPKWIGKCNSCGEWNTYVEQVIRKSPTRRFEADPGRRMVPEKITEIHSDKLERFDTRNAEFNRVLGGGLVPGSVVLIGGEPGIGKSTLALQIALNFSASTLYVSGEESPQQIKMRAERLGNLNEDTLVLS